MGLAVHVTAGWDVNVDGGGRELLTYYHIMVPSASRDGSSPVVRQPEVGDQKRRRGCQVELDVPNVSNTVSISTQSRDRDRTIVGVHGDAVGNGTFDNRASTPPRGATISFPTAR
jgi:hypothetical protein